jgi:hypothetical protein
VRRVPGARGQPARLGRALQLLLRLGLCAHTNFRWMFTI